MATPTWVLELAVFIIIAVDISVVLIVLLLIKPVLAKIADHFWLDARLTSAEKRITELEETLKGATHIISKYTEIERIGR